VTGLQGEAGFDSLPFKGRHGFDSLPFKGRVRVGVGMGQRALAKARQRALAKAR